MMNPVLIGGERVDDAVPFNRGNQLTILSAISFEKIEAVLYGERLKLGYVKNQQEC